MIKIYAGREIRTPEVRDHWISNPTPYRAGPSPHPEWEIINQTDKKVMSKQILKYPLILLYIQWRTGQRNIDQSHYVTSLAMSVRSPPCELGRNDGTRGRHRRNVRRSFQENQGQEKQVLLM